MENTQGGPASRAMLTVAILLLVFCEKKWNSEFGSGGETDGDQNLRLVAGLFMVPIVEGVACEIVGISRWLSRFFLASFYLSHHSRNQRHASGGAVQGSVCRGGRLDEFKGMLVKHLFQERALPRTS